MQKLIAFDNADMTAAAFGTCDEYANAVREAFSVALQNERTSDGEDALSISGEAEAVERALSVFRYLKALLHRGDALSMQTVTYAISLAKDGEFEALESFGNDVLTVTIEFKDI